MGWTVEMAAFESAFSNEGEMATSVDKIRPLDELLDKLGTCSYKWPHWMVRSIYGPPLWLGGAFRRGL